MRTILLVAVSAMLLSAAAKAEDAVEMKVMSEIRTCMTSENLGSLGPLRTNKEARTKEEKCFIGCMMMNLQILNSEGQYDLVLLKEQINHCPELAKDPKKKADTILVSEDCAAKVTGCKGHCECGVVVANCLADGMEAKGHETIYDWLEKIADKMDA